MFKVPRSGGATSCSTEGLSGFWRDGTVQQSMNTSNVSAGVVVGAVCQMFADVFATSCSLNGAEKS